MVVGGHLYPSLLYLSIGWVGLRVCLDAGEENTLPLLEGKGNTCLYLC